MDNKQKYRVDFYKIAVYMFDNGFFHTSFADFKFSRFCKINYFDFLKIKHSKKTFSFISLIKIADVMEVDFFDLLLIKNM